MASKSVYNALPHFLSNLAMPNSPFHQLIVETLLIIKLNISMTIVTNHDCRDFLYVEVMDPDALGRAKFMGVQVSMIFEKFGTKSECSLNFEKFGKNFTWPKTLRS